MQATTERRTHRPTGLPSWAALLLCGVEKSGKTEKCAQASQSPLIDRTFWINYGEDEPTEYDPNEYPFEIVEHDGSHRDVLAAVAWAKAQPAAEGKVNLIVFDSGSRYWAMLSDAAQQTANERWRRKYPQARFPDDPIKVTPDLWNTAADRWGHLMTALKEHNGPVIITSRLDLVTEFENDQPTRNKQWQHKVQRLGPSDVAGIIHMRAQYPEHDDWLVGIRSKRYKWETDPQGKPKHTELPADWSFDGLWRNLGLAETTAGRRVTSQPVAEGEQAEQQRIESTRQELLNAIQEAASAANIALGAVADRWAELHGGAINETTNLDGLASFRDALVARAQGNQEQRQRASGSAQDTRTEDQPAREQQDEQRAPAQGQERAPEPPAERPEPKQVREGGKEKSLRILGEELAYQADVLDVEYLEHSSPAQTRDGDLSVTKGPKYLLSQRERVIDRLRQQGKTTEADAYERIGAGFPIELHIIFEGIDQEDRAAEQPSKDSAQ